MKKTLLSLGTIGAIAAPIVGVVSCGSTKINYNTKFQGWNELNSRFPDVLYEVPKIDEDETDETDWLRTIYSAQLFKNQATQKDQSAWEQPRWELLSELNSLKEVGRFEIEPKTSDEMIFFQLPDSEENLHFRLDETHYGKFVASDEVPFKPLRHSLVGGSTEVNKADEYAQQLGKSVGDVNPDTGLPAATYLNRTAEMMERKDDSFKMLKMLVGNQRTKAVNFWKDKWFNSPFNYTPRLRQEFTGAAFDKFHSEHANEDKAAIQEHFDKAFNTHDSILRELPWQNKTKLADVFNVLAKDGHADKNGKVRFMLHLTKQHLESSQDRRSPWSLATMFWIGDEQTLEDAHPFLSIVAS